MALSDWQKLFIYDTSTQLLSQDLLSNYYLLGSQAGASLREMVLAKQPVQPITDPYDEAITGTLRADAAAVAQNARNVGEAADMMGVASSAVSQISDALDDMEEIIEKLDNGDIAYSDSVRDEYDALRNKIVAIIEDTDFNGIYMLDNAQWGTEQIDSSGQVYIQAFKNGGFNITFSALNDLTINSNTWSDFSGADLEVDDATHRQAQQAQVDDFQSAIATYLDIYEGRQSSLEFQQTELENQANLLEQAALARRQSTTSDLSPEQLLLSLLLGDSGRLLDESS